MPLQDIPAKKLHFIIEKTSKFFGYITPIALKFEVQLNLEYSDINKSDQVEIWWWQKLLIEISWSVETLARYCCHFCAAWNDAICFPELFKSAHEWQGNCAIVTKYAGRQFYPSLYLLNKMPRRSLTPISISLKYAGT